MSKNVDYGRLSNDDKKWLADEIFRLLPALNTRRRREWAKRIIKDLLWFWTADAVNADGVIKRDAIKHDPQRVRHTSAARAVLDANRGTSGGVEHEHAGELAQIIALLEVPGRTVEDVYELIDSLNVAVLVTVAEHRRLKGHVWVPDWRARKWTQRYASKVIVEQPLLAGWRDSE